MARQLLNGTFYAHRAFFCTKKRHNSRGGGSSIVKVPGDVSPARGGASRREVGGRDIWGSGGEAHGKFFGATPFKTLGNAHFEDRNTPF